MCEWQKIFMSNQARFLKVWPIKIIFNKFIHKTSDDWRSLYTTSHFYDLRLAWNAQDWYLLFEKIKAFLFDEDLPIPHELTIARTSSMIGLRRLRVQDYKPKIRIIINMRCRQPVFVSKLKNLLTIQ